MKKLLNLTMTIIMVFLTSTIYANDIDPIDSTQDKEVSEEVVSDEFELSDIIQDESVDHHLTGESIEAIPQEFSLDSTSAMPVAGNEQDIRTYSTNVMERFDNANMNLTVGSVPNGISFTYPNAPANKQTNRVYPVGTIDKSLQINLTNIAHSGAPGGYLNKSNYWMQHNFNNYDFGNTLKVVFYNIKM